MKTLPLLLAASALAIAAGCQSPRSAGQTSSVSVSGDQIVSAALQIDDNALARHVSVLGANTVLLPNGLLKVETSLASTDNRDYAVQCKYRWFDANGMEITTGGGSPWTSAILHGGEVIPVQGVAPRPNVSGFTLSVRPLR